MSNLCEAPPPKSVDALKAGDSGVTKYKYYFMLCAPCLIWCYVLPAITALIFVREKMWVPVEVLEIVEPELIEPFDISEDHGKLDGDIVEKEEDDFDETYAGFTINEFDEEIEVFYDDDEEPTDTIDSDVLETIKGEEEDEEDQL